MKPYLFFDNASTTKCCDEAAQLVRHFSVQDYGNPASAHALGQVSANAIRESRAFFANQFRVEPAQVIFTGSGSEADNLAVYGVAMAAWARKSEGPPPRVLCSAIEHPAVRKTALSLSQLGFDVQLIPVDTQGQINSQALRGLLTPETVLVSIMRVNNIVGAIAPVEELARICKQQVPSVIFHTDAVQAFGRVGVPTAPSSVDLVSISAHKVEGPKGVGALIVLNKSLLKSGLRPLIWGGEQEGGFRSGTQSPGLIAGFHAAGERALRSQESHWQHTLQLRDHLRAQLEARSLLSDRPERGQLVWNSPRDAVPHIVSLSLPGYPSGPFAKLLEERGCLVSTGSACSAHKPEPDPVLSAMKLPNEVVQSAIRISFSSENSIQDVDRLVAAIDESVQLMNQLLGGKPRR